MPTLCASIAGSASVRTTNHIPRILASRERQPNFTHAPNLRIFPPIFDLPISGKFREFWPPALLLDVTYACCSPE